MCTWVFLLREWPAWPDQDQWPCSHQSAFRRIVTVLERISSRVGAQDQHAAGSLVCVCVCVFVWVWKCVATSRVTVPGHSVWMKAIASGGWPAAETQCAFVWMWIKFRAAAQCPFTTFTVYLDIHLCTFLSLHFLLHSFLLFFQKCNSGEHVKGDRLWYFDTLIAPCL